MKTIGLIGGMSWQSSLEYYRIINQIVHERLGGNHSAKIIMISVDFDEIEICQRSNRWQEATHLLIGAARQLENAEADCVVLCTNTMHKVADELIKAIKIPFLHIVDATAVQIHASYIERIGLLGTRFTMEENFYKNRLSTLHHIDVVIPHKHDRNVVHSIIYNELVKGKIELSSRRVFQAVIDRLVKNGAQGIILGCTEIGLLVNQADSSVPLFDTTSIHAQAAVDFALR